MIPSGNAGVVEGLDGLAGEAVVAGDGVGDEGLDAGVAYILELLVVGRVHVGFMGVEAGGAPADLPDFVEFRVGGVEGGELLKGIGGEVGGEGFQRERLVAGVDVEVEIAPGAPPERLEGAMLAAVGEEAVGQAKGLAVADLVTVAFVMVLVVEGFGVGENDLRALAAGDGELRIGGGEGFAVEEQMWTWLPGGEGLVTRREGGPSSVDSWQCLGRTISPALVGRYSMCGSSSGTRPQKLSPSMSAEWA